MASTLSTVAYIYKRKYAKGAVGDLAMRDHPTAQMMSKMGGFTGEACFYAIRYGNPQALSADFATAQANIGGSQGVQLQANRKRKYGIIRLDGEALAAADGDKGSFLDLVTQETDGIIEEHGDDLAYELHRDGTGARGEADTVAGNIVTMTIIDDARNFKVDMVVQAASAAVAGTVRAGTARVVSVDEDNGTITLDNAAGLAGFAAGDFLFRAGNIGNAVEGFESHLPLIAPMSGDTFRGIDRSVDPRRLAGVRIDTPAQNSEESIGDVGVRISQVGKRASHAILNPLQFWEAAKRLDAKVEYQKGGGTADYGFEYIMVHTPAGAIKVYSDPDCPVTRGRVLNMSTWYYKTLREYVHIASDDGRPNLRVADADQIEARTRSWGNLCCKEPGANGTFSIAPI